MSSPVVSAATARRLLRDFGDRPTGTTEESPLPQNDAALHDRTLVMSGGSRGIGLAVALAAARAGANVVLLAKSDKPDPRLPGTVHTAVEEIAETGASAVAVVGDVRDEADVQRAVDTAVEHFGGVDIVVNNASAIDLRPTTELTATRFDLMQDVNVRGTWLLTRACLPHLERSSDGRVLTFSPPLNLAPHWLGAHPAYTISKYSMSMLTLGWAHEHPTVAAACLWPETLIATAAVANVVGGIEGARSPEIMADAALALLTGPAAAMTGQTFVDTNVLAGIGITDLASYGGGETPTRDIFLDPPA